MPSDVPHRNAPSSSASAAADSGLFAMLQRPDTPLLRRALLALLVAFPVWIYVTTWDALMMQFLNAAYGQEIVARDLVQMLLNNLLLLPLLFAFYYMAAGLIFRRAGIVGFLGRQIGLCVAFSVLARPAKLTAHYITSPAYVAAQHASHALLSNYYHYWQDWLAVAIQYSIVYLLGLMILIGANAFLRYKSQQLHTEQLRSRWLEARLGLLRGQLDPHFFFNALNLIVSLIRSEPRRAEKLLVELGALLRASLAANHGTFTTVRAEMEFVERYLAMMKARYEDRLQITAELDPQTLDCRIPSFLLVPLVENAIKHGVDRYPGRNRVEIASSCSDGLVTLTVKNLLAGQRVPPADQGTGTGLSNTRQRLAAIYGARWRLEAGPGGDGVWSVSVALPLEGRSPLDSPHRQAHDEARPAAFALAVGLDATGMELHQVAHDRKPQP